MLACPPRPGLQGSVRRIEILGSAGDFGGPELEAPAPESKPPNSLIFTDLVIIRIWHLPLGLGPAKLRNPALARQTSKIRARRRTPRESGPRLRLGPGKQATKFSEFYRFGYCSDLAFTPRPWPGKLSKSGPGPANLQNPAPEGRILASRTRETFVFRILCLADRSLKPRPRKASHHILRML